MSNFIETFLSIKGGNRDVKKVSTLPSIDTIYYYAEPTVETYSEFWKMLTTILKDCEIGEVLNDKIQYLGKSKGFEWLKFLDNEKENMARIGLKDNTIQKNVKDIHIQVDGTFLYKNYAEFGLLDGFKKAISLVKDELKILGIEIKETFPSRVDVNSFVSDYDFRNLKAEHFARNVKGYRVFSSVVEIGKKELETLYIGSSEKGKKSKPVQLKIYNKTLEIAQKIKANNGVLTTKDKYLLAYIEQKKIDIGKEIWNVEFSIKREKLLNFRIKTMDDLVEHLETLFVDCMKKIRYLDVKTSNRHLLKDGNNNINRIPAKNIWLKIQDEYKIQNADVPLDRLKRKRYIKTISSIKEKMIKEIKAWEDDNGEKMNEMNIYDILREHILQDSLELLLINEKDEDELEDDRKTDTFETAEEFEIYKILKADKSLRVEKYDKKNKIISIQKAESKPPVPKNLFEYYLKK